MISPTPKSLLPLLTEPFPAKWLRRMRLLWLLTMQLPPQGAVVELLAFLTETFSSTTLSDTVLRKMPLKQLWWETTCCTLALVATPVDPRMKMPCRRNFCTMPGPRIRERDIACACAMSETRIPSA